MAKREIKTTLALDGETKFKDALKDINKNMSVLNSEMALATSVFDKNDRSVAALSATNDVLNKKIDEQKRKVAELNNAYEQSIKTNGENANQTKDYQIQLNNASAALGKMEREVKQNNDAIEKEKNEVSGATKEIKQNASATENATDKTNKWGNSLSKTGSILGKGFASAAKGTAVAITAVAGAAAVGAAAIFKAGTNTGDWADDLMTLSAQTGISTRTLQEMQYATRFVDVDVETMTGSMAKLIKSMSGASDESKGTGAAFSKLGVGIRDKVTGELRNNQDVWYDTIDALGKIGNDTERDALSMQLFGKKAQELNPLILAGSQALREYGDEAKNMGLILDTEMVMKMGKFDDVMERTQAQMDGLKRQVAVTFLPGLMAVGTGISAMMTEVSKALSDGFQPEDITKIGEMITTKLVDGIKTISKYIPDIVKTISSALTEVVQVLIKLLPVLLPALMTAAIQLMQSILDAIVANLQPLSDMIVTLLMSLVNFIIVNLPLIIDAALKLVVALALGIAKALPTLIPAIIEMVMKIVDVVVENLPLIINAAIQIILALVKGLVAALPKLIKWLPTIIESLITAIVDNLDLIIDATIEIILAIVTGLIENLPLLIGATIKIMIAIAGGLIKAVPKLLGAVPKLFAALAGEFVKMDWLKIGGDIMNGIIQGLKDVGGKLKDALLDIAGSAFKGIKDFFGIHSPSTLMRDKIGLNMGLGISEGLKKSESNINSTLLGITDIEGKYNSTLKVNASGNTQGTESITSQMINGIKAAFDSTGGDITVPVHLDGKVIAVVLSKYGAKLQRDRARGLGVI